MTSPKGGFYSTQDADSEGEEGKFFLWIPAEVEALLGAEDARIFCAYFDVTDRGNFEGKNILHTPRYPDVVAHTLGISEERLQAAITRGKRVLFEAREGRVKPARDEKILTAWNGLMLRAFAEAAAVLERQDYRRAAVKNAEFVLAHLRTTPDGEWRLLRTYKDGQAKLNAYLEDYAFYADGLLALYEATFDTRWFVAARALADTAIAQFADEQGAGFFDTSADHETLVTRPKDLYDNATPSGNSVAVDVLLKLTEVTGDASYRERAGHLLAALREALAQHPSAFGHLLGALDFYLGPVREIAIAGDPAAPNTQALLHEVFSRFLPNKVVAVRPPGAAGDEAERLIPLLAGRPPKDGRATAYVCERFTCQLPVTEPADLSRQLAAAPS
jgi:uncharacterized protein YyaL (SSP411 family)